MKVLLVLFLFSASVVLVGLAEQQPQFRTSTALVRLEVSVNDAGGAIRGLGADDFVLEDNGVRQTVRVEESADAPLDLVLVAQPISSVAMTGVDQAERVSSGVTAFLDLVQDRDRLGAIVAGAPPTRLRGLTFGRPAFDVGAFVGGPYAAPFDAIAAALREFEPGDRRRALIAFTNAADFRSTISFEWLAEIARRLGPAFVLVGTPVAVEGYEYRQAQTRGGVSIGDMVVTRVSGHVFPPRLELLARRTGGTVVNLGEGDAQEVMRKLFSWLRTWYLISYEPPIGRGWHPVSVRVKRRGATVTVRDGYFVD